MTEQLPKLGTLGLIDYERCPLKDAGECDSGSWMVRADGYLWWVWCGGEDCPFSRRRRSDDEQRAITEW
jgi:hypothetical protein